MLTTNALSGFAKSNGGDYDIAWGALGSASASTTLSLAYPTVRAGDFLIAIGQINVAATISAPDWINWTGSTYTLLHYKYATGTETGSQTFTATASGYSTGQMIRIRNKSGIPVKLSYLAGYDADGNFSEPVPTPALDKFDVILFFYGDRMGVTESVGALGYTKIGSKSTAPSGYVYYAINPTSTTVDANYNAAGSWRIARIVLE